MDIRPMTIADIDVVCRIHEQVLPTTTARMGLLPLFYRTMVDHPDSHIAHVAIQNDHVIGAITATHDAHLTQRALFHPWMILRAIITSRVSIRELIDRFLTERAIMGIANPYQTILTLIVDTQHQRKGIGKKLIASLHVTGTLYVDTEDAIDFYTRCGFRILRKIRNSTVAVKTLNKAP